MRSAFSVLVTVFLSVVTFHAQDPTKAAPDSYKLQFENEYIRILRVTYGPKAKVPVHDHSRYPAAYVYLSDAGPIRFTHEHWDEPVLTRPAVKAGAFRLSPTRFDNETHAVENTGDLTSEFLRIEIMTEAPNRQSLVGRFAPFTGNRKDNLDKKEFENSQLRVTRIIAKPGTRLDVSAPEAEPSLVVIVSGTGNITKGETFWLAQGQAKHFPAVDMARPQLEILRFDFKTPPKKK